MKQQEKEKKNFCRWKTVCQKVPKLYFQSQLSMSIIVGKKSFKNINFFVKIFKSLKFHNRTDILRILSKISLMNTKRAEKGEM